jgi:hypothetical protein
MHDETTALEAQCTNLQLLVSELLLTNQKLRLELAQLKQNEPPVAFSGLILTEDLMLSGLFLKKNLLGDNTAIRKMP